MIEVAPNDLVNTWALLLFVTVDAAPALLRMAIASDRLLEAHSFLWALYLVGAPLHLFALHVADEVALAGLRSLGFDHLGGVGYRFGRRHIFLFNDHLRCLDERVLPLVGRHRHSACVCVLRRAFLPRKHVAW